MSQGRPSVRIEIVDSGHSAAPEQPIGSSSPRRRIAAAIGGLFVAAALIGVANSGSAKPVPVAPVALPTPGSGVAPPGGAPAQRTPVDLDPSSITSLAPLEDQWIAVSRNDGTLLWSGDGGLTWGTSAVPNQPQNVLAVGSSGSGQPSALVEVPANDQVRVDTQVWQDGAWMPDPLRTPLVVETGRIVSTMVARESIVVVEDTWDRPVSEVSAVLDDFVAQPIADAACSVIRTNVDGASVYSLFDCRGELVGSIGTDVIDAGSESDNRLAFARDVLRSRNTVLIAPPGRPADRIELGPAQRVLSVAPTRDGFVALILDWADELDDPSPLNFPAPSARLIHWERSTASINPLELPIAASAWAGTSVVSNGGNSVTLVTSLGLFRAESPFDDWRLATTGPKERLAPGQRFHAPLFGDGFFVDDPEDPAVFWATCCDGEMMPDGSWETVGTVGARFDRVLIATDSWVTFASLDQTIVEVPR